MADSYISVMLPCQSAAVMERLRQQESGAYRAFGAEGGRLSAVRAMAGSP